MKLNLFKIKHLVSSFLSIMESGKIVNISLGVSCICIFLGFIHNLSYVFKLKYKTFSEDKMVFMTNAVFYLNFPNVLYFLGSKTITIACFILLQVLIYIFAMHLLIVAFLKKHRFFNVLKSKTIATMNIFFQTVVTLYYWALLVPFLELFSNLMDCDWYSYFPDYQQNCPHNTMTIIILSIFGLLMVFVCGIFILWLYRTYIFLDKALLKKKFTLILLTIYLCKVCLVCLWPLIKNIGVIVFMILHFVGIFSLYDYVVNFPITNTYLSRFYISVLMSYEMLCIMFTLDCYTNIFDEVDLFYILAIVVLLSIKLGLKVFEKLYHRILILNFSQFQYLGFSLEELHRLYHNRYDSNVDLLLFCGMLKFHIRTCKLKDCVLSEKKMQKFDKMNVDEREKLLNRFVSEMFLRNIKEAYMKNQKNNKNFDSILLKYCSFLTNHNNNSIKSYYEIEHMLSLNTKKSFYFQSISLNLLRIIESLIKIYEFESKKNNENAMMDKEIDLQSFFEIIRDKDIMKSMLISLFIIKIDFWEQYKTGLHSYSQIIRNVNKLMIPVRSYGKMIDLKIKQFKNSQKRIFALKFKIMFTCFILNTVNESITVEDELEKLKKKELTLEKNIINCNSFFYGNVVTLQASFLKSNGVILESSKTIKLAKFFEYSPEEIKSLKTIESLMPEFIGKNHQKFITHYISKPRSKKDKDHIFVPTFALNKKGHIFPIKKYIGMNFDYKYNVVMHAALLDLGQQTERIVLFDSNGNFQGTTETFYDSFFGEHEKITKEHLAMFNLFSFIPDLEAIVQKSNIFTDISVSNIINQTSFLYVPEDFSDILEVLTVKLKEENESKTHNTFISYRSEKTQKSSNQSQNFRITQNSRFISKFFKTKTVQSKSIDEKQALERRLNQNQKEYTNVEILKELVDPAKSTKFYVNFNIQVHRYKLSKSEDLLLGVMFINKVKRSKGNKEGDKKEFEDSHRESINLKPPSTYKESEGIKSNFVQIPPENAPRVNPHQQDQGPDPEVTNNILMTTEVEDQPSKENNEYKRTQTLSPPKAIIIHGEKGPNNNLSPGLKKESMYYQTMGSNPLSLGEMNKEDVKNNSDSQNEVKSLSSAHKVKMNEVTSHHSSISNIKKTFSIYAVIKLIQSFVPPSLRHFSFYQVIELFVIAAYCLTVFLLNAQYIDSYYTPLENSISSLSQIYNSYSVSSLVTVRYELQKYGYASKTSGINAELYNKIFGLIFSQSFDEMKALVESERSKSTVFDYQTVLKTIQINATEVNVAAVKAVDFLDFLDVCTGILNTIINVNFDDLKVNILEYLPVNFIEFLNTYSIIVGKINNQFYSSNHDIFYTIEVIMVCLILLCFVLKIFETMAMLNYAGHIVKVINIFLRVNQNEAFNELMFSKEILQNLQDPTESYLNMACTDRLLVRKTLKLNEDDINRSSNVTRNTHKTKKHQQNSAKKNLKKFSFHNMKPLSNWPLYNYILLTFLIIFCYIFFNYYYASVLTTKIDQLIQISIFFENLYTLPTTNIMINRVIVREKVITNAMYKYPDPETREKLLYADLQNHINDLLNVSKDIPTYSLNSDILNSQTLQLIIYGDVCEALLLSKLIESDQKQLCDATLNGAFEKGLLNVITQLINSLNDDDANCKPIPFSNTAARSAQITQIFAAFKTNTAIDRMMTEYFLNKALMLFNNNIQNYYSNIMLNEMNNLKIVVLTTGICLLVFFAIILYYAHQYLQGIYWNMTLVLNLIPYEKLNNDEQTLFLIKKYWRG